MQHEPSNVINLALFKTKKEQSRDNGVSDSLRQERLSRIRKSLIKINEITQELKKIVMESEQHKAAYLEEMRKVMKEEEELNDENS